MSNAALHHVAANLPELQRVAYTDETGRQRTLKGDGMVLLVWLASVTNKDGVLFHLVETMAEETGLTPRVVKRLLVGMEQVGILTRTGRLVQYRDRGRPTPEYALTMVPGLWKQQPTVSERDTKHADQVPRGAPEHAQIVNVGGVSDTFEGSQLQPQPQPSQVTAGSDPEPGKVAGGQGELVQQIVGQCEQVRRRHLAATGGTDRGHLAQHWARKDRPNARWALDHQPGADLDTLVMATLNRSGDPVAAWHRQQCPAPRQDRPRPSSTCDDCGGDGFVMAPELGERATRWCHCMGQPEHHEQAQQLVKDMATKLRRVI